MIRHHLHDRTPTITTTVQPQEKDIPTLHLPLQTPSGKLPIQTPRPHMRTAPSAVRAAPSAVRAAPSAQRPTREKTSEERIADLEAVVGKLYSDLTGAKAQIGRLTHQLEVAEIALVREMERGGQWQDIMLTAYEADFQQLRTRVKAKAKVASEQKGVVDYDQDPYLKHIWQLTPNY
jgi:hypothetical protein